MLSWGAGGRPRWGGVLAGAGAGGGRGGGRRGWPGGGGWGPRGGAAGRVRGGGGAVGGAAAGPVRVAAYLRAARGGLGRDAGQGSGQQREHRGVRPAGRREAGPSPAGPGGDADRLRYARAARRGYRAVVRHRG